MTEATAPQTMLGEVSALRRKARADKHAYWLPVLFFGLAIVASMPLHIGRIDRAQGPDGALYSAYTLPTHPQLRPYWTVVLLGGALLTAWWYRRQGRRNGIEGRVGPALVAATLVVLGYLALGAVPSATHLLWPLYTRDHSALLVIAVGLLAMAWQERSRGLGVIAVLFTAVSVLANTYNVENLAFELGWDPFVAHPDQARFLDLPALALPAAVLLIGGAAAGLRSRWAR